MDGGTSYPSKIWDSTVTRWLVKKPNGDSLVYYKCETTAVYTWNKDKEWYECKELLNNEIGKIITNVKYSTDTIMRKETRWGPLSTFIDSLPFVTTCTLVPSGPYYGSIQPYKTGGIVSGKLALSEEQLQQLEGLLKDFDKWYAEQNKPKKKWYRFDISDAGMIACGVVGGCSRYLHEAIVLRDYGGVGDPFWDYEVSWIRKYRDYTNGDERAAFPLSKGVLIGFTDGYHGSNMGQTMSYVGGGLILGFDMWKSKYDHPALAILKKLLEYGLANGIVFSLFFK